MTARWEHDSRSPWLSQGHAEELAAREPEPMPEPTSSQALRLNGQSAARLRAAIARDSGHRGQQAAEAILHQRGAGSIAGPAAVSETWEGYVPSGRVAARICRPSGPAKEREGAA